MLILAGATVAAVALSTRPREPRYMGKALSEWLVDYDTNGNVSARAGEAVRHMGTNALPALLDLARARDSWWKRKVTSGADPFLKIHVHSLSADAKHDRALTGFSILGPQARPAIPALRALFDDPVAGSIAAICLARIGSGDALPVLVEAHTNSSPQIRRSAITGLGVVREGAATAIPLLLQSRQDPDPLARQIATNCLLVADQRSEQIGPVLMEFLSNRDPIVRQWAYSALAARLPVNPDLKVAITPLLTDTNADVRLAASNLLHHFHTWLNATRGDAPPPMVIPAAARRGPTN